MAPIVCNFIWNVKLNRSSETNSVSLYVSPIIDIVRNRVKIKKVAEKDGVIMNSIIL